MSTLIIPQTHRFSPRTLVNARSVFLHDPSKIPIKI